MSEINAMSGSVLPPEVYLLIFEHIFVNPHVIYECVGDDDDQNGPLGRMDVTSKSMPLHLLRVSKQLRNSALTVIAQRGISIDIVDGNCDASDKNVRHIVESIPKLFRDMVVYIRQDLVECKIFEHIPVQFPNLKVLLDQCRDGDFLGIDPDVLSYAASSVVRSGLIKDMSDVLRDVTTKEDGHFIAMRKQQRQKMNDSAERSGDSLDKRPYNPYTDYNRAYQLHMEFVCTNLDEVSFKFTVMNFDTKRTVTRECTELEYKGYESEPGMGSSLRRYLDPDGYYLDSDESCSDSDEEFFGHVEPFLDSDEESFGHEEDFSDSDDEA